MNKQGVICVVYPEIILSLGAGTGSMTLYGVKLEHEWHFLLKLDKTNRNPNLHKEILFKKGFQNAIEMLDEFPWHMYIPRRIHPEFAELILQEVENRLESEHVRLAYWRRLVQRSLSLTGLIH
jgi:hypothetical protein